MVSDVEIAKGRAWRGSRSGFSLLELMAAMAILLTVAGIVMGALMKMTRTQGTASNRTEMHAAVRSATELLQQEIGQAGRITLPGIVTTTSAVTTAITNPGANASPTVTSTCASCANPTSGMFVGEQLIVDPSYAPGQAPAAPCIDPASLKDMRGKETVTVTAVTATSFTAFFINCHPTGVALLPLGGFANGIVPTTVANGSTGSVLKLFGDINGDGNMLYIEYTCDTAGAKIASVGPALYRNVMAFDAAAKPAVTTAMVLLPNIQPNPGGTACFVYQQKTSGASTYVVDVSVTLTVQTQNPDPETNQFQKETKALLNVSPRNVFETWQLSGLDYLGRVQATPPTVTSLLP